MGRSRTRVVGAMLVLAASVAVANTTPAGPDVVVDTPPGPIDVIDANGSGTTTGGLVLDNIGMTMTMLTSIDRDACDPEVTAVANDALPVMLGSETVTATCSYTGLVASGAGTGVASRAHPLGTAKIGPGMVISRCQFHARNAAADLTDFTVICEPTGTFVLGTPTSSVDFGTVAIGSTVTMPVTIANGATQANQLSMTITDQSGNFKVGSPCTQDVVGCTAPVSIAPSGTTTIDVACTPTQLGPLTANLLVVSDNGGRTNPVALSCVGSASGTGPQITLDKSSLDVGGVQVGPGSASSTIHVSNTGTADLVISSFALVGGAAADWSMTATAPCDVGSCTLAAGSSTDVAVTLVPTQLNARSTTLQIDSSDPNHGTVDVALTGSGIAGELALQTAIGSAGLDLGDVPVGGSSPFQIVLRNDGNEDLTDVQIAIAPSDAYTVSPALPATVPQSGSAPVTITCTPTAVQDFPATVTISSASALTGSPISFGITCSGIGGSMLPVPSALAFGEVRTNDGSATRTIMLTDVGSASIANVPDPVLENGSDAVGSGELAVGALSTHTITPASPASFSVTVTPQADGQVVNQILVTAGSAMVEIPVSATIVTAAVSAPATRQLGSFCINQPTTATNVSLVASGTATIGMTAPALAGSDASPFQLADVSPASYPFALLAGSSATVSITPRRESTAGEQTDSIVWSTDAPDPQPTTTLVASFIDDGGAITPAAIDFGTVPIHKPVANDQLVTIQNCGTSPMALDAPTITPSAAFFVDGPPLPAMLGPSASTTISVGFAPVTTGTFDATLAVGSSGMLVVALHGIGAVDTGSGSGLGTGSDGSTNETDFYACGCHADADPSTAGALAVVAMCALVPRRRRRRGRTRRR